MMRSARLKMGTFRLQLCASKKHPIFKRYHHKFALHDLVIGGWPQQYCLECCDHLLYVAPGVGDMVVDEDGVKCG